MPPIGEAVAPGNAAFEVPADGVLPLFLTSMTQDLFKVRTGEDVTPERPAKVVPKADLLADIQARLAISDFQPAKAQILPPPSQVEEQPHKPKKPLPKTWVSLGSDKEMEEETVKSNRDLIYTRMSRRRREFGTPTAFSDKSSADAPSTECKSFRDAAYEFDRVELHVSVQAVASRVDRAVQTRWNPPANFSSQYEPLTMQEDESMRHLRSTELSDFVQETIATMDRVLRQNSLLDLFTDDFLSLGDEDAVLEKNVQTNLQEYQSFTDLRFSKDKSISCIDWHPTQKDIIGVACVVRRTLAERIEIGFPVRSRQALILIWGFHDPIHPQLILEAPDDVNCFQFNPADPNVIAGGCVNGQVLLWDISEHHERIASAAERGKGGAPTTSAADSARTAAGAGAADEHSGTARNDRMSVDGVPVVRHAAATSIELGHRGHVCFQSIFSLTTPMGGHVMRWLGAEQITNSGEVVENPEGATRQLVTCSLDGQVAFWDTRGKRDLRQLDLVWKPFLRVPLSSVDNTFDYGLMKVSLHPPNSTRGEASTESDKPQSREKTAEKGKEPLVSSKFFVGTEVNV
ncbi:WD repeat-containing protein 63 [Cladochytrium tenue]|nr:WD repeat-containing protein 63 [Cladochytrium tenue]